MLNQTLDITGLSALSPSLAAKRMSASDPLKIALNGAGPFSLKRDAGGNVVGVDATGSYDQADLEQLKTMLFDSLVGGTDASNEILNNPSAMTPEQRALAQSFGLGQAGGAYGTSIQKLRQESLQRAGGSTLGTYLVPALQALAGFGLGPGTSLLGGSGFGVGNAVAGMAGDLGVDLSGITSALGLSSPAPAANPDFFNGATASAGVSDTGFGSLTGGGGTVPLDGSGNILQGPTLAGGTLGTGALDLNLGTLDGLGNMPLANAIPSVLANSGAAAAATGTGTTGGTTPNLSLGTLATMGGLGATLLNGAGGGSAGTAGDAGVPSGSVMAPGTGGDGNLLGGNTLAGGTLGTGGGLGLGTIPSLGEGDLPLGDINNPTGTDLLPTDLINKLKGLLTTSLGGGTNTGTGTGGPTAGSILPGLLALLYANKQPGIDTSRMTSVYDSLGGNQNSVVRAATDPFQQNIAAGYGDLLQSQAVRGIRGSSFGDTDIANYLTTTGRGLANAGANAAQGSLALQGTLAGNIATLQNQQQQIKNNLFGRAFDVLGRGLNPSPTLNLNAGSA